MPGVGETLDWAQSVAALERREVDAQTAERTLGALLKTQEDIERVRGDGLVALAEHASAATPEGDAGS